MKLKELELVHSVWECLGTRFNDYTSDKEESTFDTKDVLKILRKVFELPKKPPKYIWLTLHSRATIFREKLQVKKNNRYAYLKTAKLVCENGSVFCNCDDIDDLIYPFVGKTVYLQVEYEE